LTALAGDLKKLIKAMEHPRWVPEFWGVDFDYDEFMRGLAYYAREGSGCYIPEPCKGGCGVPGCAIDNCAEERGVEICFECEGFPCERFSWFLERHTEVLEEREEFMRLGREEWLRRHAREEEKGYCRATEKYYSRARSTP
jgi:hypothetical protein